MSNNRKNEERAKKALMRAISKTEPVKKGIKEGTRKVKMKLSNLGVDNKATRMIAGAAHVAQTKEVEVPLSKNLKARIKAKDNDKGVSLHYKKRF